MSANRDPAATPAEQPNPDLRLSAALELELKRLGRHPARELRRLEREALAGESAATPAILIAGMAVSLWTLVALVVATVFVVAHLAA